MSKCFESVKATLLENLMSKSAELGQMNLSFEKMGIFARCPEPERKRFADLIREVTKSSRILGTTLEIIEEN